MAKASIRIKRHITYQQIAERLRIENAESVLRELLSIARDPDTTPGDRIRAFDTFLKHTAPPGTANQQVVQIAAALDIRLEQARETIRKALGPDLALPPPDEAT